MDNADVVFIPKNYLKSEAFSSLPQKGTVLSCFRTVPKIGKLPDVVQAGYNSLFYSLVLSL